MAQNFIILAEVAAWDHELVRTEGHQSSTQTTWWLGGHLWEITLANCTGYEGGGHTSSPLCQHWSDTGCLCTGFNLTWTQTGSAQVSVVGEDEKWAFTAVVSVSNSGILLLFQFIYMGKSAQSCPVSEELQCNPDSQISLQILQYWHLLVYTANYARPCWQHHCAVLLWTEIQAGLPESQKSIWQIDVWSMHRSKEFRDWMKVHHPNIIMHYIPAGYTGVFQACNVGIQWIFKHSLKCSYHQDVVAEILQQIDKGNKSITVEKKLGIMRDQSVDWLWDAFKMLNNEQTIKKVNRYLNLHFLGPSHINMIGLWVPCQGIQPVIWLLDRICGLWQAAQPKEDRPWISKRTDSSFSTWANEQKWHICRG